MIGLAGTEEMYSAVTEFSCSGIEITASNPINYNGMKFVKSKSEFSISIKSLKR